MKYLYINNNLRLLLSPQQKHKVKYELIKKRPSPVVYTSTVEVIILGDLHGNAIKFIYFLIKYRLIECTDFGYNSLLAAYAENNVKLFTKFLTQYVKPSKLMILPLLILLGDTLSDRGNNDYMTLKVYELLSIFKQKYIIIFSNHDMEFILNFKKHKFCKKQKPETFVLSSMMGQANSMMKMHECIMKAMITPKEIQSLIENVYLPNLKIVHHHKIKNTQAKEELLIFSHAPVNTSFLEECSNILQGKKSLNHDRFIMIRTIKTVTETIDKINSNFDFDKFIEMHNNFNLKNCYNITESYPLIKLVWNKEDMGTENEDISDTVTYIHGHIGQQVFEAANIHNLDSNFCKVDSNSYPMPVALIVEQQRGPAIINNSYF
ncbi:MAG: hypothetical protein GY750_08115 [Lentisphaerae bacterium]|nr:hypothetical protein [Lentisphaerota bacterium]MCP4101373.1 hypothetical protein [Lentisphaerota bacterium]